MFIRLQNILLFNLIFFVTANRAFASACCGGSSTIPTLITTDDRQTISLTLSRAQADTDVYANGLWKKRNENEVSETYKLDSAFIFEDRYQWGFSLPVVSRQKSGALGGTSSGLGDISAQLGYEYLPDWDYNPYRPHGVSFFSLTFPTGVSVYDAKESSLLDSRGKGFWAVSLGTSLNKTWNAYDAQFIFDVHRSFARSVNTNDFSGRIEPGYGSSAAIGLGYNYKVWRLGGSVAWNNEDPIRSSGSVSSAGSAQRFATGTLALSYLYEPNWSTTLSYADQTLFGEPVNAVLSKTFLIAIMKRWPR